MGGKICLNQSLQRVASFTKLVDSFKSPC